MFNSLKFAATLGAALVLSSAGAKADLITNGNFSTTSGYGQIGYNGDRPRLDHQRLQFHLPPAPAAQ